MMTNMKSALHKQWGSLKTLTVDGKPGGPAVILFHGYGADASDLIPMAEMMGLSADITWIFPDAPMEVIIAPGIHGKAWWQIDMKRLEKAMVSGELVDMSDTTPQNFEGARKVAMSLYDEVIKKHSRLIIGGFSQGAMLSTEIALSHSTKPAGLLILSGTLICKNRWVELAKKSSGLRFFQSHGKNDALLGFEFAERLFSMLQDAGLDGDFMPFSGGHEIPAKVIDRAASFIRNGIGTGR